MALIFVEEVPPKPHIRFGTKGLIPPKFLPAATVNVLFRQGMLSKSVSEAWEFVFYGLQSAEESQRQLVLRRLNEVKADAPIYYTAKPSDISDEYILDFYV
ncbi:hypothetical protein [Myxococcus stipitatus]|uniref:hypothetical protein n=1 Tax=Myxococcus stipitatus TaxID=83455 RepID=UPI0030D36EC9